MAKIANLEEIDRHWTIVDLAIAHQMLDLQEEADEFHHVKQNREMNSK